jgi:hypothetical protein
VAGLQSADVISLSLRVGEWPSVVRALCLEIRLGSRLAPSFCAWESARWAEFRTPADKEPSKLSRHEPEKQLLS